MVGPAARLLHRLLRSAEEVRGEQKPHRQRLRGATPLMLAAVLPFEPQPLPPVADGRAERWTTRLQMRVPLAALEFGGSFQCERGNKHARYDIAASQFTAEY